MPEEKLTLKEFLIVFGLAFLIVAGVIGYGIYLCEREAQEEEAEESAQIEKIFVKGKYIGDYINENYKSAS